MSTETVAKSELLAVQQAFAAALVNASALDDLAGHLAHGADVAARRVSIYRGNVVANVERALAASYPVVAELVGESFFGGLARAYWAVHPSSEGDLALHGEGFAGFLDEFAPARDLPYLADVARLEWAIARAGIARDETRMAAEDLGAIDASVMLGLAVRLLPGTSIVASSHPIVQLWNIHQDGFEGEFGADLTLGECALIARVGWRVRVSAIDRSRAAFYRELLIGRNLGRALEASIEADSHANHESLLVEFLQTGPLAGFRSPTPHQDIA